RAASSAGRRGPLRRRSATAPAIASRSRRGSGVRRRSGPGRRFGRREPSGSCGRARSASLVLSLVLDAEGRPGERFEARGVDRTAAPPAGAVRALDDPLQRHVDRLQRPGRILLERVVELAVERDRGRLGEVVVEPPLLAFVLEGARILVVEVLDRVDDALPLVEQPLAKDLDVERAHQTRPRRRSAAPASSPRSSTILSRLPWPETGVSERSGTPSVSASKERTSAFARPRSGAPRTRSFHASP